MASPTGGQLGGVPFYLQKMRKCMFINDYMYISLLPTPLKGMLSKSTSESFSQYQALHMQIWKIIVLVFHYSGLITNLGNGVDYLAYD